MFKVRTRFSHNIEKNQKCPFLDVTATGIDIPLKEENWQERWCSLPTTENHIKEVYEFDVRDDDVFVVTFPKCGTTWIQEATWLLVKNLDFVKANEEDLAYRSIYLDLTATSKGITYSSIEMANKAVSPRVLKSHMPAHLIPKQIWQKKCKIVYCARNPKDMAVSFYHFHCGIGTYEGDLSEFIDDLINNDIMYTPYWEHIMYFWRMREEKNIFFTTYEEMKRDLRTVLINVNKFLEKPELSEEQLDRLEKHLSFDNMKANKHANPTFNMKSSDAKYRIRENFEFMRRGNVGTYKEELSPKDEQKLNVWIEDHLQKYNVKLEDIFGDM